MVAPRLLLAVAHSAALALVALAALGLGLAWVGPLLADPVASQLPRDTLAQAQSQPWLLALLYAWVTAGLTLAEISRPSSRARSGR
jgi:hypothetical protein